jgi:hypothetical protein
MRARARVCVYIYIYIYELAHSHKSRAYVCSYIKCEFSVKERKGIITMLRKMMKYGFLLWIRNVAVFKFVTHSGSWVVGYLLSCVFPSSSFTSRCIMLRFSLCLSDSLVKYVWSHYKFRVVIYLRHGICCCGASLSFSLTVTQKVLALARDLSTTLVFISLMMQPWHQRPFE